MYMAMTSSLRHPRLRFHRASISAAIQVCSVIALSACDTRSSTVHASVESDSLAHRDSVQLYFVPRLRQKLGLKVYSVSVAVRRTDVGIQLEGPLVNADSEYASFKRIAEKLWKTEPFAESADTIAITVTRTTGRDSVIERSTYFYYRSERSSKGTRNRD